MDKIKAAFFVGHVLGAAGLVHPVSDDAGLEDIEQWVDEWTVQNASTQELRGLAFTRARNRGWLLSEERATHSSPGQRLERDRDLYLAKQILSIPAYIPRAHVDRLFMDQLTTKLQHEALKALTLQRDGHPDLAEVQDGRFVKLCFHGVPVATAQGDANQVSRQTWLDCLRSNLDLFPAGEHSVSVNVDGQQILRTSSPVTIEIHNERMLFDDGAESEHQLALSIAFTEEGAITDLVAPNGEVIGTEANMYDDLVARLADVPGADEDHPKDAG